MASNEQIVLNLAGGSVRELKATGGNRPVPEGAYSVVVADVEKHTTSNGDSIKFICEVSEGEQAGGSVWIYCGLDFDKAGNRNAWQTALVSMGYDAASIDQDGLTITLSEFVGKTAAVRLSQPKGGGDRLDKAFITPTTYAKLMADAGTGAKAAPAPVTATVTTAPTMKMATAVPAVPKVTIPAPKAPAPKAATAKGLSNFINQ